MAELTVFIPAYNAGLWIEETIKSVLSQTYRDFELLIIDDGSTDDTVARVLALKDARIRLERNDGNKGIAATRNRALDLASGKWLACLDADDIAVPHRLALQMEYLKQFPDTVVLGGMGEYFGEMSGPAKYPVGPKAVRERLPFDNPFMQNTVVLNVEWLRAKNIRYEEEYAYCEDFAFWSRVADAGGLLTNLPDVLVHYRVHAGSTSRSKREQQEHMANRIRERSLRALGCSLTEVELAFLDRYQFDGSVPLTSHARQLMKSLAKKLGDTGNFSAYEIGRFLCSALPRPTSRFEKVKLAIALVTCLPYEGTLFTYQFLAGRS